MQVNGEKHKQHNAIVVASGIAGSGIGAVQAVTHLSEGRLKKIADLGINSSKIYQNYADCFDFSKVDDALSDGLIKPEHGNFLLNLRDKMLAASKAEAKVTETAGIPLNERVVSYGETIKTANKARMDLIKTCVSMPQDAREALSSIGALNVSEIRNIMKEQSGKVSKACKIVALPLLVGLSIGAGIGSFIGMGIKSLTKKD